MKVVKKIIFSLLIILGCVFFGISLYLTNEFGNPQFEQVIDTMYTPKGSSREVILGCIIYCMPIVSLLSTILLIPLFLPNKREFTLKIKNWKIKLLPYKKWLYSLIIFFSLSLYALGSIGFFSWLYNTFATSNFFEDYYVNPQDIKLTFPDKKKNLIYIYMESMESSYSSFSFNGKEVNVIPNLTKIAEENINFSNTSSLGGAVRVPLTTWTVAGTIAQSAGIPLKSTVKRNHYGLGSNTFLPGAVMLGDILKENGYQNYYLLGSSAKFAGTDVLFKTHGDYEIFDYKWAKKEGRIAQDYKVNWGFEDSKLYLLAQEQLLLITLQKDYEPFNFTMITIDTHAVDGYTDKACPKKYDYKYANAVSCADSMLNDFLLWLQEQDFYKDTVVIISGDHLTMQTNVKDKLTNPNNRTIYNAFINTGKSSEFSKKRIFTSFDMFPTTLAALGVNIEGERLGLGTNLFSGKKTLAEKLGIEKLEKEITKKSKYYDKYLLN